MDFAKRLELEGPFGRSEDTGWAKVASPAVSGQINNLTSFVYAATPEVCLQVSSPKLAAPTNAARAVIT